MNSSSSHFLQKIVFCDVCTRNFNRRYHLNLPKIPLVNYSSCQNLVHTSDKALSMSLSLLSQCRYSFPFCKRSMLFFNSVDAISNNSGCHLQYIHSKKNVNGQFFEMALTVYKRKNCALLSPLSHLCYQHCHTDVTLNRCHTTFRFSLC